MPGEARISASNNNSKAITTMSGKSPSPEHILYIYYRENQIEQLFGFKEGLEKEIIVFWSKYHLLYFFTIH